MDSLGWRSKRHLEVNNCQQQTGGGIIGEKRCKVCFWTAIIWIDPLLNKMPLFAVPDFHQHEDLHGIDPFFCLLYTFSCKMGIQRLEE